MILWCVGWGKNPHPPKILGEKPPLEDKTRSDGMCPYCERAMEKEL